MAVKFDRNERWSGVWLRVAVWLWITGVSIGVSGVLWGCTECRFDADCPDSTSLCQGGRCMSQSDGGTGGLQNTSQVCQHRQKRPCYTGSPTTMDKGLCKRGEEECTKEGTWGPCLFEVLPVTEICDNGKDDDCDGEIDNGCGCKDGETRPCYTGKTETQGKGICKAGTQTCAQKTWSACQGEQLPQPEVCNGQDDDCDGQIDEDIPSGQPCQVPGAQGECAKGTQLCQQGQVICQPQAQPKAEECSNGKDDDCDGQIDEPPCACQPGQVQNCYAGPANTQGQGDCRGGKQTCSATGGWGPCEGEQLPQPEVCNGKDDDCDGQIDGMTKPCQQGCNTGKQRCWQGQWEACDAKPADPEICDGKDNDCNGTIDDVPGIACQCTPGQSRPCGSGIGACKQGIQQCINGQWSLTCDGEGRPSSEVCDGQDNDCNGIIDDGLQCSLTSVLWSGPNTASYFCFGPQLIPIATELARLCRFPSTTPITWQKTCLDAYPKFFVPMDHSTCRQKIYRYEFSKSGNTHHYYTSDDAWKGYQGDTYKQQEIAFGVLTRSVSGTVECKTYTNWTSRDTIVICGSTSEVTQVLNQGYTDVKSLGWMSNDTSAIASTLHGVKLKPVWRSYSSALQAHFFTDSKTNHDQKVNQQGYTNENVVAHSIP